MNDIPIGQFLVSQSVVTQDEVDSALLAQREGNGEYLGTILVKKGFVSEEVFVPHLSRHLGIDHVRLKGLKIDTSVIEKVPVQYAHFYRIVPIEIDRGALRLAMYDPQNIRKVDDLRLLLDMPISPVLCGEKEIQEALKQHYGIGADTVNRLVESGDTAVGDEISKDTETTDLEELAGDASIIRFVNQILLEAYSDRATDIHIEPYEDKLRIRYRIDGVLYDASVPREIHQFHEAIISRLKIMSNLDIAERRLPQDGRIKVRVGGEELDLRISVLPSSFGEAVNIRILSKSHQLFGLDNLGFMEKELQVLESLIKRPHGIILVTAARRPHSTHVSTRSTGTNTRSSRSRTRSSTRSRGSVRYRSTRR
jgi:type II secretory ATPase GspE/PulE/Tfp pilus assembly ATPase PilB-like protein